MATKNDENIEGKIGLSGRSSLKIGPSVRVFFKRPLDP
jgi:hypothetical protein